MSQPKITVLLTGGTIGQRHDIRGSVPDSDVVVELVHNALPTGTDVQTVSVMQRNSPDVSPQDWGVLARAVSQELGEGASGVVVLHGTDTLAYTAAALALALGANSGPVIVTGSMLPADAPDSDASDNLASALLMAATGAPGVSVVFGTNIAGATAVVLDPLRLLKVRTTGRAAFEPVGVPPVGIIADGHVHLSAVPHRPDGGSVEAVLDSFALDVDLVKVTPMTDASRMGRILAGLRGVVVEGYGAGHVSSRHIDVLRKFDGPIIVTTQVVSDAERLGAYESDRALLDLPGVVPAGPTTSVAALVALSWALGHGLSPASVLAEMRSTKGSRPA